MAEITAVTRIGRRKSLGDRFIQSYRVTIANADAADEYIVTDFKWVEGVLGIIAAAGTADIAELPVFKRNCSGTGGTEDTVTLGGRLALEGNAGVFELTVVGRI